MPGRALTRMVVALVVAGGGAGGCSSPARPRASAPPAPASTAYGVQPGASGGPAPTLPGSTTTAALPLPRPRTLVAVTTAGAVEVLDPGTGQPLRTLATGATGDEVAVTPDGGMAFYETPAGCTHQINRVATAGGQDNEQWNVLVFDRTRDQYYVTVTPAVPATGPKGTYLREAVFTPNGGLFADRECCTGVALQVTSSVLALIDPVTGATRRQVAVGVSTRDHTSLDVDGTGHWLLYLAGPDLLVSQEGNRPVMLATGFRAADW